MKELVGEEITLCKQLNELPEIVENKTNHWINRENNLRGILGQLIQ